MKIKLTILLSIIFLISCASSQQIIKSSDKADVKAEEKRTEAEKERTKDLVDFINNLELSKSEKDFLIKQIKYKDNELTFKDLKIKTLSDRIEAYQLESTKADNQTDKCIEEQKDSLVDAGAGKVLWWIFYLAAGGLVVYLVYLLLTKANLKNLFFGGK